MTNGGLAGHAVSPLTAIVFSSEDGSTISSDQSAQAEDHSFRTLIRSAQGTRRGCLTPADDELRPEPAATMVWSWLHADHDNRCQRAAIATQLEAKASAPTTTDDEVFDCGVEAQQARGRTPKDPDADHVELHEEIDFGGAEAHEAHSERLARGTGVGVSAVGQLKVAPSVTNQV